MRTMMSARKALILVAVILFLLGAAGTPLAVNTIPLGLACFAASHLWGN